ncbi:hypothetical protein ACFQ60_08435 [Streptomyces zhihengii]
MPVERPAVPLWLRHALRAQAGPVPWSAMARGAAAVLPLLAAVLAGAPTAGVPAAIGALFAGINDRPGSRRTAVAAIGVPAVAGACGLLAGTLVGAGVPGTSRHGCCPCSSDCSACSPVRSVPPVPPPPPAGRRC